jgi:pyruvate, orthophosphate dikinase
MDEVREAVALVEEQMGKRFGDASNTLLFSVRSGAAMSMPGMMDTVLNVGLNDEVVEGLARQVNERFAWDCYRRLLQARDAPYSNLPWVPRTTCVFATT